jgi:hypothetical protein
MFNLFSLALNDIYPYNKKKHLELGKNRLAVVISFLPVRCGTGA